MELKTAIWTRRSVRNFKDTPIDHADIEEIMEGTLMAPSAINLQPWYFAVLEKRFPDHHQFPCDLRRGTGSSAGIYE